MVHFSESNNTHNEDSFPNDIEIMQVGDGIISINDVKVLQRGDVEKLREQIKDTAQNTMTMKIAREFTVDCRRKDVFQKWGISFENLKGRIQVTGIRKDGTLNKHNITQHIEHQPLQATQPLQALTYNKPKIGNAHVNAVDYTRNPRKT